MNTAVSILWIVCGVLWVCSALYLLYLFLDDRR